METFLRHYFFSFSFKQIRIKSSEIQPMQNMQNFVRTAERHFAENGFPVWVGDNQNKEILSPSVTR